MPIFSRRSAGIYVRGCCGEYMADDGGPNIPTVIPGPPPTEIIYYTLTSQLYPIEVIERLDMSGSFRNMSLLGLPPDALNMSVEVDEIYATSILDYVAFTSVEAIDLSALVDNIEVPQVLDYVGFETQDAIDLSSVVDAITVRVVVIIYGEEIEYLDMSASVDTITVSTV